ncbi:20S-pre-rRNA D-site endonuclease nob1 [Vermiconidia calcicola]|uniref:20S-pre-rRNA D-site endonuclease nob1 n=1 Tax=Vermiconidia calcicola TaxID=1690605 RepID=A0ACC3N8J4_9PEZI|nr:20S-pre-rRNA D-site endonuclease nob1 [Vermiconidia calcicola]
MESQKPIHTLVLDTGPIIKNEPSVSTLLKQSENLITVPEIISEIKDAATRSRVETTLRPFLTLRSPDPTSIKFVTDFARRTGDLAVLSKPDIHIIALTYEVECQRNGGDWRLRRVPGQKRVNGAPPSKGTDGEVESGKALEGEDASPTVSALGSHQDSEPKDAPEEAPVETTEEITAEPSSSGAEPEETPAEAPRATTEENTTETSSSVAEQDPSVSQPESDPIKDINDAVAATQIDDTPAQQDTDEAPKVDSAHNSAESQEESGSDSGGWITPSNLKKKQAEDAAASTVQTPEPKTMQAAVLTTDFAMQNVILQMNLNLLSSSLTRVKHLKTFVLRCHACFQVTKDMSKQFCPRCGQPSLTRVSCSTNANGEFKLHMKKNMQWNTRGDRYSVPKAVHGSAHGRVKGGGKGSWGNDLILAEDQKEYQRAARTEKKAKERNLMDEDYLPGILTGDRGRAGGRIKVGAGRNVNARKR